MKRLTAGEEACRIFNVRLLDAVGLSAGTYSRNLYLRPNRA
jgi:hypothetical protein